jgi:hypothetical protein
LCLIDPSSLVQTVLAYAPGSHFLVQAEVSATAMYGDQFTIISRTAAVQRGPAQAQLHVSYAVDFKPSLSRLMKPMVAKGVDGEGHGSTLGCAAAAGSPCQPVQSHSLCSVQCSYCCSLPCQRSSCSVVWLHGAGVRKCGILNKSFQRKPVPDVMQGCHSQLQLLVAVTSG